MEDAFRMARRGLAAALATLAAAGVADARQSTLSMSCGEARALVASAGAIVLSTGRYTYDRFVASARFCELNEYAENAVAPTADTRNCPIGYTCLDRSYDFFRDD
jgi:hypothetical protein